MTRTFFSPTFIAILLVLILGAMGAFLKLSELGITYSSDYEQYVQTAMHFAGSSVEPVPHRLLKPLDPLLIAVMGHFTDYETAFLLQALLFYFAFIVTIYFLAYEFFQERFGSVLVALMVALSYPVLRYGVEINSETGALFLYALSLFLTLKFIKRPTTSLVVWSALVITIGFLWKEYSVVSGIQFGLALLFHPALEKRTKAWYVALCAALFLAVHVPWQLYIFFTYHYSYFNWYTDNVTGAVKEHEFTLFNIIKSTAALLGLAWLAVPSGALRIKQLDAPRKLFTYVSVPPPLMAYAWGYVQSRLMYVMAPPFLLVAYMGMRSWDRRVQILFTMGTIAANIIWLFLSYRITL